MEITRQIQKPSGKPVTGVLGMVAAALLAFGVAPDPAQAFNPQPEPPPKEFYFGPFEMGRDSLVLLHLVVPPEPIQPRDGATSDDSMPVMVRLFGPGGDVLSSRRLELNAAMVETMEFSGAELFGLVDGAVRLPVWAEVRGLTDGLRMPDNRALVAQMQLTDGVGQTLFVDPLVVFGFNPQPEPPP